MLDIDFEDKQIVIEKLRDVIPNLTRRQLECWLLCFLGFTQGESGEILEITQQAVSKHLGIVWSGLNE